MPALDAASTCDTLLISRNRTSARESRSWALGWRAHQEANGSAVSHAASRAWARGGRVADRAELGTVCFPRGQGGAVGVGADSWRWLGGCRGVGDCPGGLCAAVVPGQAGEVGGQLVE